MSRQFPLLALFSTMLLCCSICDLDAAARGRRGGGGGGQMDIYSLNVSHPFIVSYSQGTLYGNLVSDWEIGLGGGKFGVGLGMQENGSFIAFKAVAMYKWEEPFGDQFDMEDLIDQRDFPNNRWYYGTEGVLSSNGYRLALQAYRLASEHGDDETYFGASIGLGF